MVQIAGSGFGNAVNYAIVDNSAGGNSGRLWVNAEISGGIHIGSISTNVDSIYIQSGNNIVGSMYIIGSANVYGDLTAVTGSEVYVKAGSVIITNSINANNEAMPIYFISSLCKKSKFILHLLLIMPNNKLLSKILFLPILLS